MANFVGNDVKRLFADTINKLRQDIGRSVIVVGKSTMSDCPNCGWDEVKQRSNGRYSPTVPYPSGPIGPNGVVGAVNFVSQGLLQCPVCLSKGKVESAANRKSVLCLISVLNAEDAEKTPLGKNYLRNYELSSTVDNMTIFEQATSVIIDNYPCKVVSVFPEGIGDLTQVRVYAGG